MTKYFAGKAEFFKLFIPGGIPPINKLVASILSPHQSNGRAFSDELQGIARITYCEKPGGFSAYTNNSSQLSFSEEKPCVRSLVYSSSLLKNGD